MNSRLEVIKDAEVIERCEKGDAVYEFNAFRSQKIAYYRGYFITREECISFVANKMGGAHTQAKAKPLKNPEKIEFIRMMVVAISPNRREFVNLNGNDEQSIKDFKERGYAVYSLLFLLLLDTALRFHKGAESYIDEHY